MWQVFSYYTVLSIEALIGIFGIRVYEEPHYQVIGRADGIEIREYPPRVAAEVAWRQTDGAGREQAFRLLFDYIAGASRPLARGDTRIAMTAPVEVRSNDPAPMSDPGQSSETGVTATMRFFLPAKYSANDAPSPMDERVRLVIVPEGTIAVLRFSGSGSDFGERQSELITRLAASQWRPNSAPYALYYDPPFTLPFLRRNEAAVDVIKR